MRRVLLLTTSLLMLASGHALAYDPSRATRYPSPDLYRPNVDKLTINGPGTTGDMSATSITPNVGAAAGTAAKLIGDLQTSLANLTAQLNWTVCATGCTFTNPVDAWDAARNIVTVGQFASIKIQVSDGTYNINRPFYTESVLTAAVQVLGNATDATKVVFNFTNIVGNNGSGVIAVGGGRVGRPGTPGFNGVTFNGTDARTGNSSWANQSYGAAVQALHVGSFIHMGGNVIVQNFYYGASADEGGIIVGDGGFTANNSGDVNIFARHGGVIHCNYCKANVASHLFTNAQGQNEALGANYMAEAGGHLYVDGSTGTGAQVLGFGARLGGTMWAHDIEVSGSVAVGVQVDEGGRGEFARAKIHNNSQGVQIMQGSVANLDAVKVYSNTYDGVSLQGGIGFGSGLSIQNNGGFGIKLIHAGRGEFYGTLSNLTGNGTGAYYVEQQSGCTATSALCTTASSLILN